MGSVPHWYRVVRAARYLGVAPWDLAEKSQGWLLMAESAQEAEAYAEAKRQERRR